MKKLLLVEVPDDFNDTTHVWGWHNQWLTEFESKIVELPTEGEKDAEAIRFCKEYCPDADDLTTETEIHSAGVDWLTSKILNQ